nr:immunoglobulin light chain junction region [Macaca mulatta]
DYDCCSYTGSYNFG